MTAAQTMIDPAATGSVERAPMRALVSWTLYDFAAQPYYTLILTFLFAPYFASHVVGDIALGQTIWGYGAAAASVLIAIGSPFLGALADGDIGAVGNRAHLHRLVAALRRDRHGGVEDAFASFALCF